ncbi:hypothetical protein [Sphingopyxis sp. LC81]|uniref:hypothetical protein n=1 Tax=Sphingopyxis sp. LC81 TaxID=1502850 RepID=UPI001269C60A|nr:hypothetical protein [Sphingopyxis sp. LC81]
MANPVARAAARLTPFRQGQLGALCGIYCTLNALQIAAYPLRPLGLPKARSLFASAVAITRKQHPSLNPVTHGMANERMIWLAHHMAKLASTKQMRFVAEACDREDIRGWIEESLNSGAPVVACLIDWAHFSVIVDMTPNRLVLFDSQGMSSLPVSLNDPLADVIDRAGTIRVRRNTLT